MLTERGALLGLVLLFAGVSQAAGDPKFYQHIEVADPAAAVEALMDKGWSIRGYPPLSMTTPIDWAADPYDDSNWRYQLNAMYPLAPAFQLLADSYDPGLHAFVRRVFDDWIRFNLDENNENPFQWNDMATGIRATYLAQLIWYERAYGDQQIVARLASAAKRHLEKLTDPTLFAESNHGLFQVVGIAALCADLENDACPKAMAYARERYEWLFRKQFDDEGMHLEHSPEYHLLALNAFHKIERSGLLALSEDDRRLLGLAGYNLQFLIHPDGGFAEIGDTQANSARGAARFSEEARWLITGGREGQEPCFGVRTFPESGYAVGRAMSDEREQSYLLLFAGHHSRVHKHLDSGTFEWSDRGRRLVIDSGKWGYDRSAEREYVLSSRAHNTIEAEEGDYSAGDVPDRLPTLEAWAEDGLQGISVDIMLPRRFLDASWHRMLVLMPGQWLIVDDELADWFGGNHTQWFHFPPDAEVVQTPVGFEVKFPDVRSKLAVFSLDTSAEHVLARGQRQPVMLGWYSSGYHELVPSWQIGFRRSGWPVHGTTVFRWVDDAGAEPAPGPSEVGSAALRNLCWLEGGKRVGVRLLSRKNGWRAVACE
jgi:hypothetical protein